MTTITATTTPQDLPSGTKAFVCQENKNDFATLFVRDKVSQDIIFKFVYSRSHSLSTSGVKLQVNDVVYLPSSSRVYDVYTDVSENTVWQILPIATTGEPL